jgi:hypothetical protein
LGFGWSPIDHAKWPAAFSQARCTAARRWACDDYVEPAHAHHVVIVRIKRGMLAEDAMSYATDLLKWAEANPGHTIEDALTRNSHMERATRGRIRAELRKRLAEGGSHRALAVARVIVPGPENVNEAWAKGLEIGQSTLPAARRGLPQLHTRDTSRLPSAAASAVEKLADLSLGVRTGRVVSEGVLTLSDSVESVERSLSLALDHIETLKDIVREKDARIGDLERRLPAPSPAGVEGSPGG